LAGVRGLRSKFALLPEGRATLGLAGRIRLRYVERTGPHRFSGYASVVPVGFAGGSLWGLVRLVSAVKFVMSMNGPQIASKSLPRLCIIVAGMHRSGTSAVTRVVNLLGADIAREIMPAAAGNNDRGFWEPLVIANIHDQLLYQLGSSWDDPFPLPHRWIESTAAREAKRNLAAEIEKDFAESRLFVVKDPRIARLLPLWLELLDELRIEPVVVVPLRNPLEIAASLERRDQFPLAKSLLLYIRSYLETELVSRERRRFFVRYEQLLDDWSVFAVRLADLAGPYLRSLSASGAAEINKFLTVELSHHRSSREQLASAPQIAATVVEMFDRLAEAADTGDETSLRRSFDRLRETLTEATKLFQGLVSAERDQAQMRLFRLSQDHSASEAHATAENVRQRARAARLDGEREAARARAMELGDALTVESAKTASLVVELAAMRIRVSELESGLGARSDDLARANRDLVAVRDHAARSEEISAARRKELDAIKQSTIWRLSWPLRSIGAKLPWIARQVSRCVKLVWWTLTLQLGSVRHRLQARSDLQLIEASGLFDRQYYFEHHPDVRSSGTDPALHYLHHGASESRDPNPLFDSNWYLQHNPDVRKAGMNPLVHYLRHGAKEGRDPSPLFDSDWYLESNADVREEAVNPLVHYRLHGANEGRKPRPSLESDQQLANDRLATKNSRNQPLTSRERSDDPPMEPVSTTDGRPRSSPNNDDCLAGLFKERPTLNVLFITDSFSGNDGRRIAGFANKLATRGHRAIVCADGDHRAAADFGKPWFQTLSRDDVQSNPDIVTGALGKDPDRASTVVHCWTPRENVRRAAASLIERFGFSYLIHLEDDEDVVARPQVGLNSGKRASLSVRDRNAQMPYLLSHSLHTKQFMANAAGVTVAVDALRVLVPDEVAVRRLEPGVDFTQFASLDPSLQKKLRADLGVPSDAALVVYPGNMHGANAREVFSLYTAIHVLNRRGLKVHLIRTGTDQGSGFDISFKNLRERYVTELGFVERRRFMQVLRLADFVVQPGAPGGGNDYRLPSKLTEFFALGCPVVLPAANIGLRLRDRIDALLLRRGDGIEIADRVSEILHDKMLAECLGRNARRFAAENFNWSRSADHLEAFYRDVLGRQDKNDSSGKNVTKMAE
jgi:glycosyltransferase involved in cell wall biosynthesis